MNVTGGRYQLQRRQRRDGPWVTVATSDHDEMLRRVFATEARVMRYGEVRLWDKTTDDVLDYHGKPDKPRKGRPADITEQAP